MGTNFSSEYISSFDTYIIREYVGKPLMLEKNDKFYDNKYKKQYIYDKLNNFLCFSVFWTKNFREKIGLEMEISDWKIFRLYILQTKPLVEFIKKSYTYNKRKVIQIDRYFICIFNKE